MASGNLASSAWVPSRRRRTSLRSRARARQRSPASRPPDAMTSPLERAVEVMDRLRSPGGCPWDATQTHESLTPHLLEEAYEVIEAIETGDLALLREELGDLLLQVLFHSRITQELPADLAF